MKFATLLILAGFVMSAATAEAEFSIHPSIAVGEEYNDNVFDSSINKKTDYITHGKPELVLKYKTPLWDWDLNYLFDYRYYAKNSVTNDYTHALNATGLITVIDNFLFLDVKETFQRVSLDITRDFTRESLNFNQTDSNVVSASPYITLRPFTRVSTQIGYRYANIWYNDPLAISKTQHNGFINIDYEVLPKLFVNSGYTFTHSEARQDPQINNYDRHTVFVGPRYEYAEKSFIYGQGGYTIIDYSSGIRFRNPYWNVGITHTFDTYVATVETLVKYDEDPLQNITQETGYSGKLEKKFPRGTIALSGGYSEYKDIKVDKLTTTRYGAELKASYELLSKLTANLDFLAERFDFKDAGSHTRRIYVNPALNYAMPKDFSIGLNYIFVDYYSPGIAEDNRRINRAIVEVKKIF
jgi:hypothetical protein